MFPLSDPAVIRAKLEALRPNSQSTPGMFLSYAPLIYIDRCFFRIPMVHHGNIGDVDEEGIILHMGKNADLHAVLEPLSLPLIPPTMEATEPGFTSGLHLRVPFSGIIDVWLDERPERMINLWLRHAVVMAGGGWVLLPFLSPPATAPHPSSAR